MGAGCGQGGESAAVQSTHPQLQRQRGDCGEQSKRHTPRGPQPLPRGPTSPKATAQLVQHTVFSKPALRAEPTVHTCQPGAHRPRATGPPTSPENGGLRPGGAEQAAKQGKDASSVNPDRKPTAHPPPPKDMETSAFVGWGPGRSSTATSSSGWTWVRRRTTTMLFLL